MEIEAVDRPVDELVVLCVMKLITILLALQSPCVGLPLVQLLQQDLCPNDLSWGIVMVVEEYSLTKSAIIPGFFIPVDECYIHV